MKFEDRAPRGGAVRLRIIGGAVCGLAGLFAGGCGYQLRGTGSFLPPEIKTIAIPVFKNDTTRFELDLRLTQAVINEFIARGKVSVIPSLENADSVLEGEVTSFGVSPIGFSGTVQGSADRYSITISVRVTLRNLRKKTEIFSNPNYVYQTEYQVAAGTDFETSETEALTKIADLFARNLVIAILENF